MPTPAKKRWPLLFCGIFEVIYCGMTFFMLRPDGTLTLRTFVSRRSTIVDMGLLALGAGVCLIAAAIWNFKKISSRLLALNGIALSVLGFVFVFWTGPISFRTIALLIATLAISAGAYELAIARTVRRLWIVAGIVSFSFAVAFVSFAFSWIELIHGSPMATFIWIGSYFAFSAICMFALTAETEPHALKSL
jgi:hypothetical protein